MAEATLFDGVSKLITVVYQGPITTITAQCMYSCWKRWVQAGNAQFEPAFGNSVGGDPLGTGIALSGYFFVRNDLGWRVTHEPYNQEIRIAGDLYPIDPSLPLFDTTPDPHSVQFILQRSSATQVATVNTGGSSLTAQQVRDALTLGPTSAPEPGSVDDQLEKIKSDTLLIPATL